MYGDTADGGWFLQKLKAREDISEGRDTLIFGPAYAGGAPLDPMAAVAALPDDAEICGCNGVCKGKIVKAITDERPDQPRRGPQRSPRPARPAAVCTGLVEQVLAFTLGDAYAAPAAKPMCKCTDLTHEDVRRLIKAQALKSMPAVMAGAGLEDLVRLPCPAGRR